MIIFTILSYIWYNSIRPNLNNWLRGPSPDPCGSVSQTTTWIEFDRFINLTHRSFLRMRKSCFFSDIAIGGDVRDWLLHSGSRSQIIIEQSNIVVLIVDRFGEKDFNVKYIQIIKMYVYIKYMLPLGIDCPATWDFLCFVQWISPSAGIIFFSLLTSEVNTSWPLDVFCNISSRQQTQVSDPVWRLLKSFPPNLE